MINDDVGELEPEHFFFSGTPAPFSQYFKDLVGQIVLIGCC